MASPTLNTAMEQGRHNNFDVLRLVAAMSVVVSHAFPLAHGAGTVEPLETAFGMSLGGIAVLCFFFISGLLVTHSAYRKLEKPMQFTLARIGRIFPGLLVALVVTTLVAFASGGSFTVSEAGSYVLRGITLVSLQHELAGSFADNPYPFIVNGPLWTLFYEVACYAILAAAVWLGLLRHWLGWCVATAVVVANWTVFEIFGIWGGALGYRLSVLAPLALAFLAGALAWRLRSSLPLSWSLGVIAALATFLVRDLTIFTPLFIVTLSYGILLLAYRLPAITLGNDISYGIYIYGWPVAQAVLALFGPMSPVELAVFSGIMVVPVAAASWFFIEQPALNATVKHINRKLGKLSSQPA